MAGNIYKVTLVLLLCGVIGEINCNTLSEKRDAGMEVTMTGLEERFDEMKKDIQEMMREQYDGRFEKMENDIQSINEAVTKLVPTLLKETPEYSEGTHDVRKRDVISNNPLTNLPDARLDKSGGTVYTRWGRTECGSDSTLLYKGYAGGSNFDQSGGGVNYQCMPLDPQYNSVYTGSATWYGSYMAGVEYESHKYGIFPNSAHDQNAPCARCYTNDRSALMMIPAKRDCSEGWNKEYEGYLMTQYYNHNHQTTFECVDASPEYINGEGADNNGGLFYFIRTQCDRGGHCPPYDGNKEITCVVCTK